MTKRLVLLLAALTLLIAACGREGPPGAAELTGNDAATAAPTASAPMASASAAPAATASVAPTAAATQAPAGGAQPATSNAPGTTSGGVNRPKAGSYTYDISGEAANPLNPGAPPQKFSGEQIVKITHSGNITTQEATSSNQAGRTTLKTRYDADKIVLVEFEISTQGGTFACKLDPGVTITKLPVKPEKYPQQQIKGQGNACDGTVDITVERAETVKDATGKAWTTWRVKVIQVINTGQFNIRGDETRWVSPDLGAQIRSQSTQTVKFGANDITGSSTSVLKKHP